MDIPHVIVCSNYIFNQDALSKDSWRMYRLEDKKLVAVNEKVRKVEFEDKEKILKK